MAILCCCGHLRSRKRSRVDEGAGLPVPPPPAKLPAAVLHPSAISPGSTHARSSLTNPLPGAATDALVHLAELVVEESDEDEVDEDPAHDSRNRSTSTLQAVKSCIRRHLSEDSLQRQSETEEQIAHRAEVKRLMRKRIQEELQSETDNAPSHSSTPQRHGPGPVAIPGNGPRDTIEFTVDESQRAKELTPIRTANKTDKVTAQQRPTSKLSFGLPSNPSFEKENRRPTSLAASEPDWMDAESRASHIECHIGIRQRNSLPDMPNSPGLLPVPGSAFHDASSLASWRLSLSADKLADLFTPDKTLTLFRPLASTPGNRSTADLRDDLSLSRPRSKSSPLGLRDSNARLRTHSRQISLDSTLCSRVPASKSLMRDESPVGLWLRTQSMPFRPCTTSQPPSEFGSEDDEHKHSARRISHPDPPEGQLSATPTRPSRVRRSGTNRNLSLTGSPSDSSRCSLGPARRSLQTAVHPVSRVRDSVQAVKSPPDRNWDIRSAMSSKTNLVSPRSDLQQPSLMPPVVDDATIQRGETMPSHPYRRGTSGLRIPSFKWPGDTGRVQDMPETKRSMTPPWGGSATFFTNIDPRRATIEAGSETSSFLRREAELRYVEERFRNSHLRKGSFNAVESKFREMFDHDGDARSHRTSLLSKLHLNVPKRGRVAILETLDGNTSGHALARTRISPTSVLQHKVSEKANVDDGHLQVPDIFHGKSRVKAKEAGRMLATSSANTRRLRGFSSSKDGDDTAELWKRAVRAESESRSPRGSVSSNVPGLCGSSAISGRSEVLKAPQPSGATSLTSSRSGLHSPLCKANLEHGSEAALSEALRRSSTILEEWAHQLETQGLGSQEPGEGLTYKSRSRSKPTNLPPASWAKFPSYNRNERNASAGVDDKVRSRDFAVKKISSSGTIAWATDKAGDSSPSQKGIARTFSDKFSQTFKSRLSKLMPGRSRTPSRDRSIRGVRRSSIQIAGDLEYPELEILPKTGGYRDLRALESEIHEMKGVTDAKTRSTHEEPDTSQLKSSLAEHMATAMSQKDGCSEPAPSQASDTGSFVKEKASLIQLRSPETPALQIRYPETTRTKESTGSTVERYATPLSHLSSSGNDAPSSVTPDFIIKVLPSAHSSSSLKSAKSLMRSASLRTTPDHEACTFPTQNWQPEDDLGRRPASMLTARASG